MIRYHTLFEHTRPFYNAWNSYATFKKISFITGEREIAAGFVGAVIAHENNKCIILYFSIFYCFQYLSDAIIHPFDHSGESSSRAFVIVGLWDRFGLFIIGSLIWGVRCGICNVQKKGSISPALNKFDRLIGNEVCEITFAFDGSVI